MYFWLAYSNIIFGLSPDNQYRVDSPHRNFIARHTFRYYTLFPKQGYLPYLLQKPREKKYLAKINGRFDQNTSFRNTEHSLV